MSQRRSRLDRAIDYLPWALAALLGGVALHLLVLLSLPTLTPRSAYAMIAADLPLGAKRQSPRAAPGQDGEPNFADPFATLAYCRFNLAEGPLRLRAAADGEHPLSVSVRLADGTIIYSANDRQTPKGAFNIVVLTQKQAEAQDEARDNADPEDEAASAATDELRLIAPRKTGFAVFRVMSLREGDYEAAAARRAAIECLQEKN